MERGAYRNLGEILSTRPISLAAALAVVLAGAASGAQALAAPAATAAVPLALSHYSHMLVDAAHGHLYFSEGAGTDGILVTDLTGGNATTIGGEPGATALALSADGNTMYAALADGNAISAVDTTTLTEKARYATGDASAPSSIAVSGGKVWYSYTATGGTGGIGAVDPGAAAPSATPQAGTGTWAHPPVLAAASAADELVAEDFATSHMAAFALGSGTPVLQADRTVATTTGAVGVLRVSPDGADVLAASLADAAVHNFRTSDLGVAGPAFYYDAGVGSLPDSAAFAADGTLAVGAGAASGADLFSYAAGPVGATLNTYDLHTDGTTATLAADGLAWEPNQAGLYAVTADVGGGYRLHLVDDARMTSVQLTVDPLGTSVEPTLPFAVSGQVSSAAPLPAGTHLQVSRGTVPLPDATVDANGRFSFGDTVNDAGSYQYFVSYAGDATHRAAGPTSVTVQVDKATTSIRATALLAAPDQVELQATVVSEAATGDPQAKKPLPLPAGAVLDVTRTSQATGQTEALPSVPVDPVSGAAVVLDAPGAAGAYVYHLSYAGTAALSAAGYDLAVDVAPLPTALRLKAPVTGGQKAPLTLTGSLSNGPYPAGEKIQFTRTDPGTPAGVVVGSAALNTDGTFSFVDTPPNAGTVTYTARYLGDAAHSSALASAGVTLAYYTTSLTITADASAYAYGKYATLTAHLGSPLANRTVSIYALERGGSGTRVLIKSGVVNSNGNLFVGFPLRRSTTFYAISTGDLHYGQVTATTSVYTYVGMQEKQSGNYASVSYAGNAYAVYHHTAKPAVAVTVLPSKAGECVQFQLQEYLSGAWHVVDQSGCYTLNAASAAGRTYALANAVGHHYRWNASYARGVDQVNLNTVGAWQYFMVNT